MIRLSRRERELSLLIFEAILPADQAGLAPFRSAGEPAIFEAIEAHTSPSFLIGFRAMLELIEHLPLIRRGYRARFSRLDRARRIAFIEELNHGAQERDQYLIRQTLESMKLFAGLAYFDAPEARARFIRGDA